MYALCHIFFPIQITINQRTTEKVTRTIANNLLKAVEFGFYDLLSVYPYYGEIEEYPNDDNREPGIYVTISIELDSIDGWEQWKGFVVYKITEELKSFDLHISSYSDEHIAFIKDYD